VNFCTELAVSQKIGRSVLWRTKHMQITKHAVGRIVKQVSIMRQVM